MSATLGNDDFYSNLLQYMNQNTQNPFLSQMPNSFSPHEAEKHGLDESMTDESDNKRRESTNSQAMDSGSDETESKPKKKPGRKMMMTEPANKRKAQNRAAQRAFRERKEAHVKGLESRVTELEELTQTKDEENLTLKKQVELLQAELKTFRGGDFNFDFTLKNLQKQNTLNNNTTVRNPFQQSGVTNGQQSSPSPSSGSITDSTLFRSGRSSLATSPENDANKTATPNIDIPFDLFNNSAGPVNFTNNNSNQASPLFSTDLFGNSPSNSNGTPAPALFNQNQGQNTSPILDTFAQTLASLTAQNQSPTSMNGFNGMSSTSTAPLSSFTPGSNNGNLFDMNDPLFTSWRDNSISSDRNDSFDIFDTMFSSMSPGAFNFVDSSGLTDFITDSPITMSTTTQQTNATGTISGEQTMTCPELWDKVKSHPQFDDIDIDQLCAEMKSKAKCSNSGAVVTASDVDEAVSRIMMQQ